MNSYCKVCRASKPFVGNVCQSCGAANTKDCGPFVPRYPPCPKCNGGAFRVSLWGRECVGCGWQVWQAIHGRIIQ